MKRKVIQIAGSTQLISLPRKWAQKHGIKKGEELEVKEEGSRIIVGANSSGSEAIDIDASGLSGNSLKKYIENAYRLGYDEINIKLKACSDIQDIVDRLIGVEIVQQNESLCVIKDISSSSAKEFDSVLKRILLLVSGMSSDLRDGLKSNDRSKFSSIESRHQVVTKFVNYCLRLMNKGYGNPRLNSVLSSMIAKIQGISSIVASSASHASQGSGSGLSKLNRDSSAVVDSVHNSIEACCSSFFRFDTKVLSNLVRAINDVSRKVSRLHKTLPANELLLVTGFASSLGLLDELSHSRLGIEL